MSGRIALFAGQGAQAPGMGMDLAQDSAVAALFESANQALQMDLRQLCFEGPAEELTKSNIAQPAIFVVSVAAYRSFAQRCPQVAFAMVAGLSLGEWSALHVAGVLDFASTLRILEARGRLMQQACEEQAGGMISIMGASDEQLQTLCQEAGIAVANLNSDSQVVLSGLKDGIAKAAALAAEMGVRAIVLNVAGAFHSPLMASAREKLAAVLDEVTFHAPRLPVLSNVTGRPHSSDPALIKESMLRQVTESVHWNDSIKFALAAGNDNFIEFGPGKVLSGLVKRIDRKAGILNVADLPSLEATVAACAQ